MFSPGVLRLRTRPSPGHQTRGRTPTYTQSPSPREGVDRRTGGHRTVIDESYVETRKGHGHCKGRRRVGTGSLEVGVPTGVGT